MRSAIIASALVATAAAGGVSSAISPTAAAPASCSSNYPGMFQIQDTLLAGGSKRSLEARDTPLTIMLSNGILKDSVGRTGYLASNMQFQFDDPPQAGAIYTAGFTICSNGSLALGDDAIWWSCLSGSFSNIYYESQGGQCKEVTLQAIPYGGSATTAPPASGPTTAAAPCTEYKDGQPQCTPTTAAPPPPMCTEYKDGQPQCSAVTAAPACTEYKDGQPQCSAVTAAPAVCSEYKDGQPQCSATTAAPACTEYKDGQPQCSAVTAAPAVCSEYSDGQPQCATATPSAPAVCSEYSDGQPQCATATPTVAACTEYVDGQPQCPTAPATGTLAIASSSYTGAPIATGAAANLGFNKEMFGLAAGILAVAVL
ncbi:hypothetical protein BDY17DRAFT_313666 [Neohortaea acidophila]|uniref:Cell wall mannoprotein PIR1-like C-terminal domain-containing protein n=1 Tax=Neohortaea acidophila TaxID=245834 RepID=A0A6A6PH87_9PEZI|nr:uncharacterized protein BDY17DRAFT_313666 [Neohortaea acidophila]KAF2479084.1 hypothetical protein BDY17DRAFT_313666 [Neohortaea acidophila]